MLRIYFNKNLVKIVCYGSITLPVLLECGKKEELEYRSVKKQCGRDKLRTISCFENRRQYSNGRSVNCDNNGNTDFIEPPERSTLDNSKCTKSGNISKVKKYRELCEYRDVYRRGSRDIRGFRSKERFINKLNLADDDDDDDVIKWKETPKYKRIISTWRDKKHADSMSKTVMWKNKYKLSTPHFNAQNLPLDKNENQHTRNVSYKYSDMQSAVENCEQSENLVSDAGTENMRDDKDTSIPTPSEDKSPDKSVLESRLTNTNSKYRQSAVENCEQSENFVLSASMENLSNDEDRSMPNEDKSVLESHLKNTNSKYRLPCFISYINESPVLQKFQSIGVNFDKLETMKEVPEYLAHLDLEKDVAPHLKFLSENGVDESNFARFITKNPFIFRNDLDDMGAKIMYLKIRKFSPESIAGILNQNPRWLNYSIEHVKERLNYIMKEFNLSEQQIRSVISRYSSIIIHPIEFFSRLKVTLKEELGLTDQECKILLTHSPRVFDIEPAILKQRFEILTNEMGVCRSSILDFPFVLLCRTHRLRDRHEYLKYLGKNQYDNSKENYLPLKLLVSGDNEEFCTKVAKTSVNDFNYFLNTR